MDAQLKQKWLTALKSGEYTHCRGDLRRDNPYTNTSAFCALGVLIDIQNAPWYGSVMKYLDMISEPKRLDIQRINDSSDNYDKVIGYIEKHL